MLQPRNTLTNHGHVGNIIREVIAETQSQLPKRACEENASKLSSFFLCTGISNQKSYVNIQKTFSIQFFLCVLMCTMLITISHTNTLRTYVCFLINLKFHYSKTDILASKYVTVNFTKFVEHI